MKPQDRLVTVAICTRNRPADLRRAIRTVLESDYAELDLVVVDQSSDDESRTVVTGFEDARIRYVRDAGTGIARSRNIALAEARTDLLVFTDDDCTVSPGWLRRHVEVMDGHKNAACSFGALVPVQHDRNSHFAPAFRPSRFRVRRGKMSAVTFSGCSANVALRVAICRDIAGFDESLGSGSRFKSVEDIDLACRALRQGFAVIEDPCSVVDHWGFRPYADGSVQRYMRDVYYAEGARQMRDLRAGELWAVPDAAYRIVQQVEIAAIGVVRHRRPTGIGRLFAYARGLAHARTAPIDRRSGLFANHTGADGR